MHHTLAVSLEIVDRFHVTSFLNIMSFFSVCVNFFLMVGTVWIFFCNSYV